MLYDAQTINSRSSLKRWSHLSRFKLACEVLAPRPGERILDYGAGDGTLLRCLHEREPDARLVGFEPMMPPENAPAGASIVESAGGLTGFDKVACLEVLEHLEGSTLTTAIDNITNAVRPGGMIVVSVPIEIGPSGMAKTLIRTAIGAGHENATVANTFRSLLCRTDKITRRAENGYILSHVGFDWRSLRKRLLALGPHEKQVLFSPLPGLGPWLNSQIFMIFQR